MREVPDRGALVCRTEGLRWPAERRCERRARRCLDSARVGFMGGPRGEATLIDKRSTRWYATSL